jgi:Cu(I)/Ag(I) efflux system membrane fusion protein
MMNPEETEEPAGSETANLEDGKEFDPVEIPEEFRERVRPVVKNYLDLQTALAADSFEQARMASGNLTSAVKSLSEKHLSGDSHGQWMVDLKSLDESASTLAGTTEMEKMRESFYPLSQALESFVLHFGHGLDFPIRRAFCPMALEDGATWIQVDEAIANPYYGASMLRCGEIQFTYPSARAEMGDGE